MQREIIKPESKQEWLRHRTQDLTSTEMPALFGLSPYMTRFELWHQKKNQQIVELEENERMKWGNRLQDSIALGLAADMGWQVRKKDEYMRIPDLRLGSSFDFQIGETGLLEIKNVDALQYRDGWDVDDAGNIDAPAHIEMQIQHQMLVSGLNQGKIGALIGGNRVVLIDREIDSGVHDRILEATAEFWKSIVDNRPPEPDFIADADFISKLYRYAEPGKVIEADSDIEFLAAQYALFSAQEKEAKAQKDGIKAELLTKIGDAEKVKGNGFSISASYTQSTLVPAYERAGFRNFRVTWPKKK